MKLEIALAYSNHLRDGTKAAHAGGIASATLFNFFGHRILTFTRKQSA